MSQHGNAARSPPGPIALLAGSHIEFSDDDYDGDGDDVAVGAVADAADADAEASMFSADTEPSASVIASASASAPEPVHAQKGPAKAAGRGAAKKRAPRVRARVHARARAPVEPVAPAPAPPAPAPAPAPAPPAPAKPVVQAHVPAVQKAPKEDCERERERERERDRKRKRQTSGATSVKKTLELQGRAGTLIQRASAKRLTARAAQDLIRQMVADGDLAEGERDHISVSAEAHTSNIAYIQKRLGEAVHKSILMMINGKHTTLLEKDAKCGILLDRYHQTTDMSSAQVAEFCANPRLAFERPDIEEIRRAIAHVRGDDDGDGDSDMVEVGDSDIVGVGGDAPE